MRCGHAYSVRNDSSCVDYKFFGQRYPKQYLLDDGNDLFAIAKGRLARVPSASGKVLEIGCGYGHFLRMLSDSGMNVHGIESSVVAAEFARGDFGLDVSISSYGAGEEGGCERYGMIAAFHVLEHIENLSEFMARIRDDLAPSGHVMIAVPNIETLPMNFTELYFIARGWHRHTFSPGHLIWLLECWGFRVVEALNEPHQAMSPSSFLVVASKQAMPAVRPIVQYADPGRIVDFHVGMNRYIETVKRCVNRWHSDGDRVAFYGGGLHTEAVLTLCDITPEYVDCIIDDDFSKQGGDCCGIPIVSADSIEAERCNVVVVSTLAAEQRLIERMQARKSGKVVYGVYQNLLRDSLDGRIIDH